MSRYLHVIFCCTTWLMTSCENPKSKPVPDLHIEQKVTFSDSFNVIYLSNNNETPVSFQFEINNLFPLKMDHIIQAIEDSCHNRNSPIEEEAWRYVSHSTFWSRPISLENWQHDPILFLNSIGGGFCDDRASVLASIWKNWFDSVRVMGLNGHVVPEVYSSNKWKMYDPDHMVAYLNDKREVCSLSELEDSSQFISSPGSGKVIGTNPILHFNNPFSKFFSDFFATKQDNEDATSWHLDAKKPMTRFILPAYSFLKIEIDQKTHQVNLSVGLSEKSKGELQIPFVPYSASGTMEYQFEKAAIAIHDSVYFFPTETWTNSIDIKTVKSNSTIRYLVNPRLNFFQTRNFLNLKSDLPVEITNKQEKVYPHLPYELNQGLFFNEKATKYSKYSTYLSNYKGVVDEEYLNREYRFFLSSDTNLSLEEKDRMHLLFQKDWKELNLSSNEKKMTEFENLHPKSTFYLFIASKYRKSDFIKTSLSEQS